MREEAVVLSGGEEKQKGDASMDVQWRPSERQGNRKRGGGEGRRVKNNFKKNRFGGQQGEKIVWGSRSGRDMGQDISPFHPGRRTTTTCTIHLIVAHRADLPKPMLSVPVKKSLGQNDSHLFTKVLAIPGTSQILPGENIGSVLVLHYSPTAAHMTSRNSEICYQPAIRRT